MPLMQCLHPSKCIPQCAILVPAGLLDTVGVPFPDDLVQDVQELPADNGVAMKRSLPVAELQDTLDLLHLLHLPSLQYQ